MSAGCSFTPKVGPTRHRSDLYSFLSVVFSAVSYRDYEGEVHVGMNEGERMMVGALLNRRVVERKIGYVRVLPRVALG